MIKLGRIDIIFKVSLLSSHVALVHVIAHVGQRYDFRLVYDPSYPEIDQSVFEKYDWSEFYKDAKETIPINVLKL